MTQGELKIYNATLKFKDANVANAVLPQGEYQAYLYVHDDIDADIFNISFKFAIKSPYKNTFGQLNVDAMTFDFI